MDINSKIYIAGHTGLVGSALLRNLKKKGYNNFILRDLEEMDLINQEKVDDFFKIEKY